MSKTIYCSLRLTSARDSSAAATASGIGLSERNRSARIANGGFQEGLSDRDIILAGQAGSRQDMSPPSGVDATLLLLAASGTFSLLDLDRALVQLFSLGDQAAGAKNTCVVWIDGQTSTLIGYLLVNPPMQETASGIHPPSESD